MDEVTEADLRAASNYFAGLGFHGDAASVLAGERFRYTAQAFARHRLSTFTGDTK